MPRPIETAFIIILAAMELTACAAGVESATTEQQPTGVELNPNGESKIFWVFNAPQSEWQQTGGPGSLVPGFAFGHCGDDYYANDWARKDGQQYGQPVYAGISGIVHVADIKDKNGNYIAWGKEVIIYNPDSKFALRYAHLSEYDPSLNDKWISATSDKPIGRVGDSGLGTGPHLHLVLYKNANSIDIGNPVSVSSCSVKDGVCQDRYRIRSPILVYSACLRN
jgi:murein DD-endopeptidase MepM/ murein hydrolase activator NlpD